MADPSGLSTLLGIWKAHRLKVDGSYNDRGFYAFCQGANYFDYRITNGFVEGKNNRIKTIKRMVLS